MPFPPAPASDKKGGWLSFKNLKKLRWPILAAGVLGGPYAYFEGDDWAGGVRKVVQEWIATSDAPRASGARESVSASVGIGRIGAYNSGVATSAAPTQLSEIFRFDISPAWVTSHWSEVSLGMADVELSGHRVLLVTGPRPHDLAGALTYYFDRDQQVQRIRFEGVTGDPRPLVAELAAKQGFVRCRADVPGTDVYQVHRKGQAAGDLRIRSAPVVRADSPLGRYSISLAVDRPDR